LGIFTENLSAMFNCCSNQTKLTDILHKELGVFMYNLAIKAAKFIFLQKVINIFIVDIVTPRGQGSVVGITTGYGMDGLGIESR
jgi:hypothetical protein